MGAFWASAIVIWFACGLFSSIVASGKGHSGGAWFVLGFLFGPLALLASIGLSQEQSSEVGNPSSSTSPESSTPVAPTHEHHWERQETPDAKPLRRCSSCGLIEAIHDHKWSGPIRSQKHSGRLYQNCGSCSTARYLDESVDSIQTNHIHAWSDTTLTSDKSQAAIKASRCEACGLIHQLPHEHNWSEALPSARYKGRFYQECLECRETRYID
jgi:hypothetical protein